MDESFSRLGVWFETLKIDINILHESDLIKLSPKRPNGHEAPNDHFRCTYIPFQLVLCKMILCLASRDDVSVDEYSEDRFVAYRYYFYQYWHTASASTKYPGISCICLLYTSPSPRDLSTSRMPSSA